VEHARFLGYNGSFLDAVPAGAVRSTGGARRADCRGVRGSETVAENERPENAGLAKVGEAMNDQDETVEYDSEESKATLRAQQAEAELADLRKRVEGLVKDMMVGAGCLAKNMNARRVEMHWGRELRAAVSPPIGSAATELE
jgi:hypothetical protein